MTVILVVNGFPDAQRSNYCVYNALTAQELSRYVDLTVIVPHTARPGRRRLAIEVQDGFTLVRLAAPVIPRLKVLTLRLFSEFSKRLADPFLTNADVVHSVGVEFAGLLVASWSRRHRYCHVTQLINDINCVKGTGFQGFPFKELFQKSVRAILCNSRTLEARARQHFPKTPIVRTLYRGTDLAFFSAEGCRSTFLEHDSSIKFLFMGGIPPYPDRLYGRDTKGGLTLMKAWAEKEEDLRMAGASLFFGGPCADGKLAGAWRNNLRFPERVRLRGVVPRHEMPNLLRAADIIVIPSREEGFPNLAFEAFASGKPILGSDIGPLSEVIEEGRTGFTFQAGNAEALAGVLWQCVKPGAHEMLRKMGVTARRVAEVRYDCRNYAGAIVDVYREALAADSKKGIEDTL